MPNNTTSPFDTLMKEAKAMLKGSHEAEDGHQINYDEGYIAGLKDAKKALEADIIERQKNALLSFIETIEATGGVNRDLSPVGDPEWQDLGEAYAEACSVLGCRIMYRGREQ